MSRLISWAIIVAAFGVTFAILATAAPAQMQVRSQCGPHTQLIALLATRYLEAPKAIGTVSGSHYMEIYVSQAGSWTVLVTSADGISCIIAAGSNWEDVPFEPGERS